MVLKKRAFSFKALVLLLVSPVFISCGGGGGSSTGSLMSGNPTPGSSNIVVAVTPAAATLPPGGTHLYSATVTGTTNTNVTWSAGGIPGGNSTFGTIDSSGMYTAPANLPNPIGIKIVATSAADNTKSASAIARVNDNVEFQNGQIRLGTSGGNFTDKSTSGNKIFCCSGTLGSLVSRGGSFYILSNNHVLDKSDQGAVGDPISQPGLADTNCGQTPTTTVATMAQAVTLNAQNNVDAALAKVTGQTVAPGGNILDLAGIGQPAPPSATPIDASLGMSVSKSGDATGLTCGTINFIDVAVQVMYQTQCQGGTPFTVTFDHQVSVLGSSFSDNGDSGSLIVETGTARPVALLYAGSNNGTVGNPIQTVLNALKDPNTGEVPQIVGGGVHQVSCPATTQSQVATQESAVTALPQSEKAQATLARNHRAIELMQDPAVERVEVGRSSDNPAEPAVLITLRSQPRLPIPAQVDGLRTKIVQSSASTVTQTQAKEAQVAALADSEVTRARDVKHQRAQELMATSGIIGVGVGASNDSPGESALVIFVEQGKSVSVPAVIDGVRTRIIVTDPFRTFNWGKSTVKACSRR